MKKIALIMFAGSVMLFGSCTKSGPQGPVGPQGPAGLDGNANVLGSNPFTVTTWGYSTSDVAYMASFNDADITQAVSDRGVVEIFLYYPGDQTWRPLPDVVSGTEFFFRYNTGGFDIYFANLDGTTPVSPATFGTGSWTFRSVVISPSNKQAHPNTNWKNYNEVMSVLNEASASGNTTTTTTVSANH